MVKHARISDWRSDENDGFERIQPIDAEDDDECPTDKSKSKSHSPSQSTNGKNCAKKPQPNDYQ